MTFGWPTKLQMLLLMATIVAAMAFCVKTVAAHGDAAWIMANPATSYCCGPNDCVRLPKSSIKILASGFGVMINGQEMVVPYGKELPSIDDDYWACVPPGGSLRCFFAPPLGT